MPDIICFCLSWPHNFTLKRCLTREGKDNGFILTQDLPLLLDVQFFTSIAYLNWIFMHINLFLHANVEWLILGKSCLSRWQVRDFHLHKDLVSFDITNNPWYGLRNHSKSGPPQTVHQWLFCSLQLHMFRFKEIIML